MSKFTPMFLSNSPISSNLANVLSRCTVLVFAIPTVPTKTPLIGGHEGVGDIVAIGENTVDSPVKLGDRVGIKWIAYSCVSSDYDSLHVIHCPLVLGVSSVNSAETLMSKVSI